MPKFSNTSFPQSLKDEIKVVNVAMLLEPAEPQDPSWRHEK